MSEDRERIMREAREAAFPQQQPRTPTPEEVEAAEQQVRERAARAVEQRRQEAEVKP
ncbi:hypothetical protein [Deinococcus aluminii]|uniref:Uncharacterized protein n=1 Tax=Deinococcus aluminii TaxID=1656885 RepID=A0ABP9XH26_9DEIO